MNTWHEGDGSAKSSSAADQLRRPPASHFRSLRANAPIVRAGAEAEGGLESDVRRQWTKQKADAAARRRDSLSSTVDACRDGMAAMVSVRSLSPSPRPLLCVRYR